MNGEERLLAAIAASPVNVSQVSAVLLQGSAEGLDFERAWFNAIRAVMPPRTGPLALQAETDELRHVLREAKPWFRAAYEGGEVTIAELDRVSALSERRLDRLMATTAPAIAA